MRSRTQTWSSLKLILKTIAKRELGSNVSVPFDAVAVTLPVAVIKHLTDTIQGRKGRFISQSEGVVIVAGRGGSCHPACAVRQQRGERRFSAALLLFILSVTPAWIMTLPIFRLDCPQLSNLETTSPTCPERSHHLRRHPPPAKKLIRVSAHYIVVWPLATFP